MSEDKKQYFMPSFPSTVSEGQKRWFYGSYLGALVALYLTINQAFMPPQLAAIWVPAFLMSALFFVNCWSKTTFKYEALSPITLSGALLVLVVLSDALALNFTLSFSAMVLASILLSKPLGWHLSLMYSVPASMSLITGTMLSAGPKEAINVALILGACGFYLYWPTQSQSPATLSEDPAPPSDQETSDNIDAEQTVLELRQQLNQREQDFEREIQEQTRYLRDANTQLSEQIGLRKTISDALVKSQTRLTQAIDASKLGLIDWDIKAGQFYQSAFHEHFGSKEQSSEEVIQTLKEVIHPEDYITFRDTINRCLSGSLSDYTLQYRVLEDRDSTDQEQMKAWCWIEECCKVVDHGADGRADRMLGTRRNIQDQVERNEQVRLAKSVFDHTSEGVYVLDTNGVFLSANPAYANMMNCSANDLVGQSIQTICDTPSRSELYAEVFSALKKEGNWQGELLEKKLHGDYFHQRTELNVILNEQGDIQYYSGMVADITDSKAADEKLDYLLNYDDLTKLANRVQFQDQLHRALVRYKDEERPFALVLLDVDRFKQFNDSFGHARADKLLEAIAERLSANVQSVDILARVGGNEFACIVECSETFSVDKFAQRLFKAVTSASYEMDGHPLIISCSVGVALVPEHTKNIQSLMRYGALAVQKAKYHGGNQIQLFDESLKSFSRRRLEMEHALRKALKEQELEVYYQPKYDLKQQRITSYEALIRWEHPSLGLISPEEFVNIAEENGLITDLGAFVLKQACTQTRIWMEGCQRPLHVSVNLSARQLRDDNFFKVVSETIEESGLPSDYLELELTESAIMEDLDGALELLGNIRKQGVKVSVDDFGTGYSSLSYLKSLPVDTLKIDRSFVDGMESSIQQQAIVKAIMVLGSSLDLQIVAEGVENDAQLHILQALGCDLIQGYHVSKPLNAEEMGQLLQDQGC